jgi:Arc/MetJ-type ribon-helix-helix transcriptional regulator
MAQTTFRFPDNVDERVEERLATGQPKSVWFRYAATTMIQCEKDLDELFGPYEFQEREEFVRQAVQEKIEDVEQQNR